MADVAFNTDLQSFQSFVEIASSPDQAAGVDEDGAIGNAKTTASWRARTRRSSTEAIEAVGINNEVRQRLVTALERQFKVSSFGELPKEVRKALVGRGAVTATQDFKFDKDGNVTSGRPLTARRISAVLKAATDKINETVSKALTDKVLDAITDAAMKLYPKPFKDYRCCKMAKTGYEFFKEAVRSFISTRITGYGGEDKLHSACDWLREGIQDNFLDPKTNCIDEAKRDAAIKAFRDKLQETVGTWRSVLASVSKADSAPVKSGAKPRRKGAVIAKDSAAVKPVPERTVQESEILTPIVDGKRYSLSLLNNKGLRNCFFYALLGSMDPKLVDDDKAAFELRQQVHATAMNLVKAAQDDRSIGLVTQFGDAEGIQYLAKYTDSEDKPAQVNIVDSAYVSNVKAGWNHIDMDPLDAAFVAHHLKRPVVVISDFSAHNPALGCVVHTFDYDLMTGRRFSSDQEPLRIYYASGHFQTIRGMKQV